MGYNNSYSPLLLSHQTGLSITASTALTYYVIGTAVTIPRNGIVAISMIGYVSGGYGYIQLKLERGINDYFFGSTSESLFADYLSYDSWPKIETNTPLPLSCSGSFSSESEYSVGASPSFILPVLSSDTLVFQATNNTANDTVYIDDLLVILQ
ncbi:MAG: hypothetical protein QW478_13450 [Candidatus Micrarchaeaceae archaeon]